MDPDPPHPDAAIPKGLSHSAQGREERVTLGNAPPTLANSGGVASSPAPLRPAGAHRLRDAHAALDAAVLAAYGVPDKMAPLAFLLRLKLELADKEAEDEPVTSPALPTVGADAGWFIRKDCMPPHR